MIRPGRSRRINHFFFNTEDKYFSNADTIEGAWGSGALISIVKPASCTALEVLLPKAPIFVPICLNLGKLSKRLRTPLGVKKQMISYSLFTITSLILLLMVRYIKGVTKPQLFIFNQPTI